MASHASSESSLTVMTPNPRQSEKEPDVESQNSPLEKSSEIPGGPVQPPALTFPEGGLRAWSVVLGVR